MKTLTRQLFVFFAHLGGFGLLGLGILDSSFLFMPLGNDLLVIAMTANHHEWMLYYVVMATAGSVLGCLLVDLVCRKGGEEGLEKHVPRSRLEYVKRKVKQSAGWALAIAAIMPPPFPFTIFVIASAALQYPRKRLLAVIAMMRLVRFSVEGLLAIEFGKSILRWAQLPELQYAMVVLVLISIGGSALSIYSWIKRSRNSTPRQKALRRREA